MYLVYILKCDNLTYVGMTNDFFHRWQQHNGILSGGARSTKKKCNWYPICIIDGFKTKSEAMQCEWKCKRAKGYLNRVKNVSHLIEHSERWTKNSPLIKDQDLKIYLRNEFKKFFEIETGELSWF